MNKDGNYIPLQRGTFVQLRSWRFLAQRNEVFHDSLGEYIRFPEGGIFRRRPPEKDRLNGMILDASDRWKLVRFSDGTEAELPAAVLVPVVYKNGKFVTYHRKQDRMDGISRRRWKSYMQDSIVRRVML